MNDNDFDKDTDFSKQLPPKPTDLTKRLEPEQRFKLEMFQARTTALLPVLFFLGAMSIMGLSFKYPNTAEKLEAGAVVTTLLGIAGALAKSNS